MLGHLPSLTSACIAFAAEEQHGVNGEGLSSGGGGGVPYAAGGSGLLVHLLELWSQVVAPSRALKQRFLSSLLKPLADAAGMPRSGKC